MAKDEHYFICARCHGRDRRSHQISNGNTEQIRTRRAVVTYSILPPEAPTLIGSLFAFYGGLLHLVELPFEDDELRGRFRREPLPFAPDKNGRRSCAGRSRSPGLTVSRSHGLNGGHAHNASEGRLTLGLRNPSTSLETRCCAV